MQIKIVNMSIKNADNCCWGSLKLRIFIDNVLLGIFFIKKEQIHVKKIFLLKLEVKKSFELF